MAINNPLIPGDPYSYDLKWIIATLKKHGLIIEDIDKTITDRIDSILAGREINIISTLEEMRLTDLKPGHTILTTGYYESGDGGAGIYVTRSAEQTDVDDGGSLIVVGDTAAELCPINGTVITTQFGCKGDQDTDRFQALIDYCLANGVLEVHVDKVDLTGGSVYIDRGINSPDELSIYSRKNMVFKGVGAGLITKNDDGFIFDANVRTRDFVFDGIKFRGYTTVANAWQDVVDLKVFNCDKYINVHVINCTFNWLKCVFYQEGDSSSNAQGIYSENNLYSKCYNIMKVNSLWVAQFVNDLMEDGGTFLTDFTTQSNHRAVLVEGCTLEGSEAGPAILLHGAVDMKCCYNYFEDNLNHIVCDYLWTGAIIGNRFGGRGNIPASSQIYCINVPITSNYEQVVTANHSSETTPNTTLIKVRDDSPFNNASYSLFGDNFIETGGTLTDKPEQIVRDRWVFRKYALLDTVDISAQVINGYSAVTSGTMNARVKNGQVILTFANVIMTGAVASGTIPLASVLPLPDMEYSGALVDGGGNTVRMFMTNQGALGFRGGAAGTFAGQLVYNM